MAITSGSGQKRKVKSDPMKKLRSSLDFTKLAGGGGGGGDCNLLLFRPLCSKLNLLSLEDRPTCRGSPS